MANLIVGVDEVGRGAWFGPVVAVAVLLPESALTDLKDLGVKDSKLLSVSQRLKLADPIKKLCYKWQVGYGTVKEIDQMNILTASLWAMKRAVLKLKATPQLCLIDGPYAIPDLPYLQQALIGGDKISPVIGAASILAKLWRDQLITSWAKAYPYYDLARNKGYGTPNHRAGLASYGPSAQHRLSFSPCQLALSGKIVTDRE